MSGRYTQLAQAKNGTIIPVFSSGQAMFSKYNPERDAEAFSSAYTGASEHFFLVCGIGNALHIAALRKRFPTAAIVAVESGEDDIAFLEKNFSISRIARELDFSICSAENVFHELTNSYVPVIHGDFVMLPQRAWADNHRQTMSLISEQVKLALSEIAADTSTQAHFGRRWHRNIIQNLLFSSEIAVPDKLESVCSDKEAFVAAAGPSLDKAIPLLKDKGFRAAQYLIASDTALPVLLKNSIIPDMTVSIDGQMASCAHFMGQLPKSMILAADITAFPAVIRRAHEAGCPVMLTRNKHPLSALVSDFTKARSGHELPQLTAGAGTVTVTAFDIAFRLGFKRINMAGADFCYRNGKAYSSGTYFDEAFACSACKTKPAEQGFVNLFYGRQLQVNPEGNYTTANLSSYRHSFESYLAKNHLTKISNGEECPDTFIVSADTKAARIDFFKTTPDDGRDFLSWYIALLEAADIRAIQSILPLAAWYKKKNCCETDIFSYLKLAYSQTVLYNRWHGK